MSSSDDAALDVPAPTGGPTPGMLVRAAREAAGMSIDDVAQQLKLAPRQVRALEGDDYALLPGRTFVRGFLRNYARLLGLDAGTLLDALPDGSTASLDRPAISPTTRVMGELPAESASRSGSARWAIPLAFVAIVAIAAAYLWRPGGERARSAAGGAPVEQTLPRPALPAPAPASSAAPASPAAPATAPGSAAGTEPAAGAATAGPAATADTSAPTAAASDTPLVFVFRGTSWVEVKDARGNVLLSTMGYPGSTHAVGGILPLDVVLGNAEAVQVSVRGEPFDTSAYVKQNVAKFQVK